MIITEIKPLKSIFTNFNESSIFKADKKIEAVVKNKIKYNPKL
jgi:hypothetical protein